MVEKKIDAMTPAELVALGDRALDMDPAAAEKMARENKMIIVTDTGATSGKPVAEARPARPERQGKR